MSSTNTKQHFVYRRDGQEDPDPEPEKRKPWLWSRRSVAEASIKSVPSSNSSLLAKAIVPTAETGPKSPACGCAS